MTTQTRLPNPGQDDGTWGDILNTYLEVEHNTDGSLKIRTDGTLKTTLASLTDVATSGVADGQVLSYSSGSSKWEPATVTGSGSVADATTGNKGIVQLAGDLGGTAASPTVPGLASKLDSSAAASTYLTQSTASSTYAPKASPTFTGTVTVPTPSNNTDAATKAYVDTNTSGKLSASSNLSDLASAGTARTNLGLGTAATISSTAGGDLSGTLPAPTVAKVNGVTVTGTPANGYILTATGTTAASWQAAASGFADPTTTKGDLIVHGTSTTRLGVGTNGQVLTADSTQTNGVKWATASAGSGGYTAVAKSSAYTASSGDFVVCDSSAGGFIVTLPAAASGAYVRVKKKGTDGNTVSVVPPSGQIDGSNSISVNGSYASQDFMSDGTSWYQV